MTEDEWKIFLQKMYMDEAGKVKNVMDSVDEKKFYVFLKIIFNKLLSDSQKLLKEILVKGIDITDFNEAIMTHFKFGLMVGLKLESLDLMPILINQLKKEKHLQEIINYLQQILQDRRSGDLGPYI